jgi:hypothetical protein
LVCVVFLLGPVPDAFCCAGAGNVTVFRSKRSNWELR